MKTRILFPTIVAVCTLLATASSVFAQGTAFTYQGLLTSNGVPVNTAYDLEFTLFNAASGPSQVGNTVTYSALPITNGVFSVLLDFGNVYNGTSYWLQISNRPSGGGAYTALTPRQQLTPTPYAVTAENVDGLISASQLTGPLPPSLLLGTYGNVLTLNNPGNSFNGTFNGAFSGDGSGLIGLNASQLTTGTVPDARLSANVALLDRPSQTFTGSNIFLRNSGQSTLVVSSPNSLVPIDTTLFSGLGFQYNASSGEGAIMASYNDGFSELGFYTKAGGGRPIQKQMRIDQFGNVTIDQANFNAGFLNNGLTNGPGLTFGSFSGEGIASQRTPGVDLYSLSFYTAFINRMIIMNNGSVGIGTTNPTAQLQVVRGLPTGKSDTFGGGPGIWSDDSTSDAIYASATGSGAYAVYAEAGGAAQMAVEAINDSTNPASGGDGVYASTTATNGSAIYLTAANQSSAALTIGTGGIRVANAGINSGTAAFIHAATSANTANYITTISNPLTDGDPNAILIVTHSFSPPGGPVSYETHPFSVWYNGSKWTIYHDDITSITNQSFNVLVIKH